MSRRFYIETLGCPKNQVDSDKLIGTLLAETKLSNKGIGFLIINAYSTFDMPRMYANLIVLFALAIAANALIGRLGGRPMVHAVEPCPPVRRRKPFGEQSRRPRVVTRSTRPEHSAFTIDASQRDPGIVRRRAGGRASQFVVHGAWRRRAAA